MGPTTALRPNPWRPRSRLSPRGDRFILSSASTATKTRARCCGQSEIASVTVDENWLVVVLGADEVPRERLNLLYAHLKTQAPPNVEVEIRSGGRVFRGGLGLGPRRHVLAVLGGKGGVGKSTVAVNLALTLAAMGSRVGILDGDLNGPDIPHLLGVHPSSRGERRDWRLAAIRKPGQRRK